MGSKTKISAFFLLFCLLIPSVLAQENPQMITVFNNLEEVPERPSDDIEFNGITIISTYVCRFTPGSENTTSFILDFGDEKSATKLDPKDILRNRSERYIYLFNWDKVPGNHNETLLKILRDNFGLKWAENATINKSPDNRTIYISKDENTAEIIMDEKNENATIKDGDKIIHVLEVITENDKLNLYQGNNCYDKYDNNTLYKSFRDKKPLIRYELEPINVKNWKISNVTLKNGSIRVHATVFEHGFCSISLVFPIITEDLKTKYQDFFIADKPLKTDDIVSIEIAIENKSKEKIFEDKYRALKNKFFGENEKNEEFPCKRYRIAYAWNITNFLSWDKVPGSHNETLLKILRDDLKLKWAEENATINKSRDNRTIYISKDNNTAEIIMDKKNEKATIKVGDEIKHVLKVRTENRKPNLSTNKLKHAKKLVEENPWEVCGICAARGRWKDDISKDHIISVVSEVFQWNTDNIQFFYPVRSGFFGYEQNPGETRMQDYGYDPKLVRLVELIYLQVFMLEAYNQEISTELEELKDVEEKQYPDKIKDIANLKREIIIPLEEFYLIEDSLRHGVDIVYIQYGKQRLGLDIVHENLRDKMDDLSEISSDMYEVYAQESMSDLTKMMLALTIFSSILAVILVVLGVCEARRRIREKRLKK